MEGQVSEITNSTQGLIDSYLMMLTHTASVLIEEHHHGQDQELYATTSKIDKYVRILLIVKRDCGGPDLVELSGPNSWCSRVIRALHLSLKEAEAGDIVTRNHAAIVQWICSGGMSGRDVIFPSDLTSKDIAESRKPAPIPKTTKEWIVHYFGSGATMKKLEENVNVYFIEDNEHHLSAGYKDVLICWGHIKPYV